MHHDGRDFDARSARGGSFYQPCAVRARPSTSQNSVPALQATANSSFLTLLDANLSGGASGNAAITNTAGRMLIRNLQVAGYGTTISNAGGTTGDVPGTTTNVAEWTSHPVLTLFPSATTTLNLPVETTPTYDNSDPEPMGQRHRCRLMERRRTVRATTTRPAFRLPLTAVKRWSICRAARIRSGSQSSFAGAFAKSSVSLRPSAAKPAIPAQFFALMAAAPRPLCWNIST